MDRFDVSEVYGMHNAPGDAQGHFLTTAGPLQASADEFRIDITGKGGHGASPQECIDPIPAGAAIVQAMQTIVSRNVNALDRLVVSVTEFHAGTTFNIIPETAYLTGTVRCFSAETRDLAERRIREIVEAQAQVYGCTAKLTYDRGDPVTINHPEQAAFAAQVAREVVGDDRVTDDCDPIMPAEDFSYMLEARPGAYLFLGQGDTFGCHHPKYDFNDEIAPIGASFFARLIETALPLQE